MYAFSSKSGSEPFRALGDLTWNDPPTNSISNKYNSKIEDTRCTHPTSILSPIKKNNILVLPYRRSSFSHTTRTVIVILFIVLRIALLQAHIFLNTGREDLPIPFTNVS